MNAQNNAIRQLLTAFVHDTALAPLDQNLDYAALYKTAKQQHIDGILGYLETKYNFCTDNKTKEQLINSYFFSLTVSTNQANQFSKVKDLFLKNQIDLVVFKGYVLRDIYPVVELRSFSDIDILIKKQDRNLSHQLMQNNGYKTTVDYGKVYSYQKNIEYYELHEDLISNDIFHNEELDSYFSQAWNHVHKIDNNLYAFDEDFHLIYLIAHIAKHIHFGGAGIRMYLDIALFIKHYVDTFDFENFIQTIKALKIDKFAYTVIYAACTWFGITLPKALLNEFDDIPSATLDQLYSFTINKGIFGNSAPSAGEATVQIMKRKGSKHPRFSALMSIAFPPISVMKLKHTYLEKAPVLLPFAWLQRAFSNIKRIKYKKQKIKDIVSTDEATITTHAQLLSDIGL